ncbi:MAG: electron transport complex subunit RsxC [Clostridia bacterium]|nr:electron transport complex subunit RsxC [Clostridia bacterium]
MKYTFKGGIHPGGHKNTAKCNIKLFADPEKVSIPLSQHIGAPCECLVKKGDRVLVGQKIGAVPEGALGAPVHSSVSGTVEKIEVIADLRGNNVKHVVIANDHLNEQSPDVVPFPKKLSEATTEEIVAAVKEAGIVGMGGAGFPAHAKISSAIGKATTLIVNCVECEPYLTCNYRLMMERPEEITGGAKIILKALGTERVYIAIEDNKPLAIKKMTELVEKDARFNVVSLKTKYPQGDERRLIYALTGKELPRGKLPADLGCVIFNAETLSAIYNAMAKGAPSVYRTVTVDGDAVAEPSNVLVPIGTSVRDVVEFCGGLKAEPDKIINGGPMMGNAVWSPDLPVTKTTSGLLLFSAEASKERAETNCIRCGRCIKACPSGLAPCFMVASIKAGLYDEAERFNVMNCVECGSCSFGCPAGIPLVQYFKLAKSEINKKKKKK